ncbi:MAG: lytic transglycosylase domain-containing protein [Clostridiales bacterium]|nr:lytic transglycosylase domain-containing protein [Clostridiales bacterium]
MKKSVKLLASAITAAAFALIVVFAVTVCVVFPNKYVDKLCAAADEFGLSRSLVKSVVWAESRFDEKATSRKGAKGLMQLMPDTFDYCATAIGLPKNADAFDAQNSLRCGCYYLSLLIDKFDGNVTAALMAYNAGEANAHRFLAGEPIFPETKKYLASISKARKVYGLFGG